MFVYTLDISRYACHNVNEFYVTTICLTSNYVIRPAPITGPACPRLAASSFAIRMRMTMSLAW